MSGAIVWFRFDLRLLDNPAIFYACQNHNEIIPVYIYEVDLPYLGAAQAWWLHHSLISLAGSLKSHHANLIIIKGKAREILKQLIKQYNIDAVYWNHRFEPKAKAIDKAVKQDLEKANVQVRCFNGNLFFNPWEIKNKTGAFFKVFTPFWKTCRSQLNHLSILKSPHIQQTKINTLLSVDDLALIPQHPNWAKQFSRYWEPGEVHAHKKLQNFIQIGLRGYDSQKDFLGLHGTSRLSPHLHFGEITPRIIWDYLKKVLYGKPGYAIGIERYLAQLGWREFSYYLLYHFPNLSKQNFKAKFDRFPWKNSKRLYLAWQKGLTGYPIVDAAMRELWHTGYMHNRARMVVASFLTKDLLIDWQKGAQWFWYTLLDADLANNSAGWQWVAGCGADASPYFRVFNPITQGEKFDSSGDYVKQWIPELAKLPPKYIHKPWTLSKKILAKQGLILGKDYPLPIVEHSLARKRALFYYKALR